jgi:iron complex transport system ATP-binding protein
MNSEQNQAMIRVEKLSKSFGAERILYDIDFTVAQGAFFGIIGPNGSGKSTLLQIISGIEPVSAGQVCLEGKDVSTYSKKELARWVTVLQQDALPPVHFSVREVVEMGRYPFQSWLGDEKLDSSGLIDRIMQKLDISDFSNRHVDQLSGGERQRVALAKSMAQQPRLLLLDEPTTFLDIGYQIQMMDYIRNWQEEADLTIVAVLHDLNLAAQYCDQILVLHEGEILGIGTPQQILTSDLISQVYGTKPIILPHPISGVPQILLQPGSCKGSKLNDRELKLDEFTRNLYISN